MPRKKKELEIHEIYTFQNIIIFPYLYQISEVLYNISRKNMPSIHVWYIIYTYLNAHYMSNGFFGWNTVTTCSWGFHGLDLNQRSRCWNSFWEGIVAPHEQRKKPSYFPLNPGFLIGSLIMALYNWVVYPLYTLNNQDLFIAHMFWGNLFSWPSQLLPSKLPSPEIRLY